MGWPSRNSYANEFITDMYYDKPITVASRSKACTVFARSNAGIVGSNPTQDMDLCVRLFCFCVVLCVGTCLATGWSPSKESYRLYKKRLRNWRRGQSPAKCCRAIDEWLNECLVLNVDGQSQKATLYDCSIFNIQQNASWNQHNIYKLINCRQICSSQFHNN
jgi:hypothetical protein